jgi:predicted metal-dependent enzyme (double-stranded beta helix superfamily)
MKQRNGLGGLVDEVRRIAAASADHQLLVDRLVPVVRRAALAKAWLEASHYECDSAQGFGVHVLHEEADHRLAILAVSWLPAREAPPHNHGTWAVVAGVRGAELNTYWRRLDDGSRPGYAELAQGKQQALTPGRVSRFLPSTIHSVRNETDEVTLSLHVYGIHPNYAERSQFDPQSRGVKEFKLTLNG